MDDWKKGLDRDNLINAFWEIFLMDLESWFDSCSFYCDSCSEHFIRKWPGIYHRDLDFQKSAIMLDTFYDGSRRLSEMFTKQEYFDLIKDIPCPNCGDSGYGFIYPYEMKFEEPVDFEDNVGQLALLAENMPFLLLSHSFAKNVYDELHKIAANAAKVQLPSQLYRARYYDCNKTYTAADFVAPPKDKIKEGRYNHAGDPVLYVAEDRLTCFYEMRCPEVGIIISEMELPVPLRVLDLMDETLEENEIIQSIKWSSLLSSPAEGEGWHKPHYVFTRFIADVAQSAGFDAIRYPSVRFYRGNNYVILRLDMVEPDILIREIRFISKDVFKRKGKTFYSEVTQ